MDGYRIALFVHLLALLAATGASTLTHLADARQARASTVGEAAQWLRMASKAARTFPLALLVLLASGGYMVGVSGAWSWTAGWVDAGIAGVAALFLVGATIGRRGRRMKDALEQLAARAGRGNGSVELPDDHVARALSWMNTGIALAVVFVMSLKPQLTASLAVLLVGAVAGIVASRTVPRLTSREVVAG